MDGWMEGERETEREITRGGGAERVSNRKGRGETGRERDREGIGRSWQPLGRVGVGHQYRSVINPGE